MKVATTVITQAGKVQLLGLDFGSTTCSALVAQAQMQANSVTGHMALGDLHIVFRSKIEFTPFRDGKIDEEAVLALLKKWRTETGLQQQDIFAGGVIITGLAARQENARRLTELIQQQIGEVLIATADDPGLESWLAFMGGCAALSRFYPNRPIVNLDIGGGTTNPALGLNGQVLTSGCYLIGARHVQLLPGSYQIVALTPEAQKLFNHLHIYKHAGDTLTVAEKDRFIQLYIDMLEQLAEGNNQRVKQNSYHDLEQQPFVFNIPNPAIVFSGGVGELVYQAAAGEKLPETTYYGDLGIDLAQAILASPILSRDLGQMVPENRGRATVYGLALHSTEISGSTLFLPDATQLPLRNLPIIGRLNNQSTPDEWRALLQQAVAYPRGFGLQLQMQNHSNLQYIRQLGALLATLLRELTILAQQPIVILVDDNIAKSLGLYATEWGRLRVNLIVIDEIYLRQADFVNLGSLHQHVVPVAFYGVH